LKNRGVNGSLKKANNNNNNDDANPTTIKKYHTITNGKNSPTNEITKTNSLKKKIFTRGRNSILFGCWGSSHSGTIIVTWAKSVFILSGIAYSTVNSNLGTTKIQWPSPNPHFARCR
jgi:hypothetical protein